VKWKRKSKITLAAAVGLLLFITTVLGVLPLPQTSSTASAASVCPAGDITIAGQPVTKVGAEGASPSTTTLNGTVCIHRTSKTSARVDKQIVSYRVTSVTKEQNYALGCNLASVSFIITVGTATVGEDDQTTRTSCDLTSTKRINYDPSKANALANFLVDSPSARLIIPIGNTQLDSASGAVKNATGAIAGHILPFAEHGPQPCPVGTAIKIYNSAGKVVKQVAVGDADGGYNTGQLPVGSYKLVAQCTLGGTIYTLSGTYSVSAGYTNIQDVTGGALSCDGTTGDCFTPLKDRTYKKDCNIEQSHTGWLFCQMIKGMAASGNKLDEYINALLTLPTSQIFDTTTKTGNAYHQAWANIRNIALAVLVLAALIMVVSQALGLEILDAYTVRKVLPRVLIATIFISLSWSLMLFAVSLTNDLGGGLRNIIYEPFTHINGGAFGLRGGGGALAGILLLPGVVALKFSGVTSLIATGFLSLFIGFLVMIIREIAVTMLIVLAPLAIVCSILPNTNKAYKLWWESFSKALIMFPLIAVFIAAGRVFAVTSFALSKNAPGHLGPVYELISVVSYFIPYFLLPLTIRFAGGFVATLGGAMNDRGRGAFDRLKKGRQNRVAKSRQELGAGMYLKGQGRRTGQFNNLTASLAALPEAGLNPRRMRSRIRTQVATRRLAHIREFRENDHAFGLFGGNDDVLEAIFNTDGTEDAVKQYIIDHADLAGSGRTEADVRRFAETSAAQVRAARRRIPGGLPALRQAAVVDNGGTGTGYGGGIGKVLQAVNRVSGDDVNVSANLLHEVRHAAQEARRFDISDGDLEHQEEAMEELRQSGNGDAHADEITEHLDKALTQTIDPRKLMTARSETLKHLAPHMGDGLRTAVANGDKKAIARELAKITGIYDRSAGSAKEIATILADTVLAERFTIDGKEVSVQQMIDQHVESGNTDYLELRRELSEAQLAEGATAEQIAAFREAQDAAREAGH
jgi:hypothetical protein